MITLPILYNRIISNQKGATSIEVALILTFVFIPLVFGIIEFGLLMYNQHVVTNAAREGARSGIVFKSNLSDTDIIDIVNNYGKNHMVFFSDESMNPHVIENCSSSDFLSVNATYQYHFLFLDLFLDPINLTSITKMRCE